MTSGGRGWEDAALRRIERGAVVCCLAAVGIALVARGGRPDAALGVLGGGILAGASFWAIRRAVDGLVGALGAGRRTAGTVAVAVVLMLGRYALLGFLAYVMIARLRLHPVGLLAGASSVVAAVVVEAGRGLAGIGGRHR